MNVVILLRVYGGVKNGKFVTLVPFQKYSPKSMKPPLPTQSLLLN